jgi:hypothetical protein
MPKVKATKKNTAAARTGPLSAYGHTTQPVKTEAQITSAVKEKESASSSPQTSNEPPMLARAKVESSTAGSPLATQVRIEEDTEGSAVTVPKKKSSKPLVTGAKDAVFNDDSTWDVKHHQLIGTSTRKIRFRRFFILTK